MPTSHQLTPVQLAAQLAVCHRTLQQRQQREASRGTALEELRPVHPDTGIGQPLLLGIDDVLALEREISARMLWRVGYQHQPGKRARLRIGSGRDAEG